MRTVLLHGKKFHLKGNLPRVGSKIPDIELADSDLLPVSLSSFQGKPLVILSVPSLDTPTCEKETKHFYELLQHKAIHLIVVSLDLPFAQKRFCTTGQLTHIHTLSDYKTHHFGDLFGVRIEEIGLLARAVFVVDSHGILLYEEVVPVLSDEPNYHEALKHLKTHMH